VTRNIDTKHALPNQPVIPLHYYKEWDTQMGTLTVEDMLNRTGVRKDTVPAEGLKVGPKAWIPTDPGISGEMMMINNWGFAEHGTSPDQNYPYQNMLADTTHNFIRKNTNGVWEYYWGTPAEVTDMEGVPGQNTTNPKSTFEAHWVAQINGKIYDPSYGNGPFETLRQWEEASVAGLFILNRLLPNNVWRMFVRKNPATAEDIEVWTQQTDW
jgi:hypothetical protein